MSKRLVASVFAVFITLGLVAGPAQAAQVPEASTQGWEWGSFSTTQGWEWGSFSTTQGWEWGSFSTTQGWEWGS